jgi:ABC-type Fe3+-hydroxamate transport system substrate-binding protein
MITVTDQTGERVSLPRVPRRIVSLVPSQTELLYDLGLDEEVVGITKFCVHPESWFRTKTRIGGTKKVEVGRLNALGPDLVIANKEENTQEDVEAIRAFCPVWTSDVGTVDDALSMIRDISFLCGLEVEGGRLENEIRQSLVSITALNLKAAYLIWKDPYMTAGGDTFIHHMMEAAGIENVFKEKSRYPEVSIEDIRESRADLVLLSSEPYPFKIRDIAELSKLLPKQKLVIVDGEMFSWYGSRMRHFAGYIRELTPKP